MRMSLASRCVPAFSADSWMRNPVSTCNRKTSGAGGSTGFGMCQVISISEQRSGSTPAEEGRCSSAVMHTASKTARTGKRTLTLLAIGLPRIHNEAGRAVADRTDCDADPARHLRAKLGVRFALKRSDLPSCPRKNNFQHGFTAGFEITLLESIAYTVS